MGKGLLQSPFWCVVVITAISFLSYSNTFTAPFHFDDVGVIIDNPIIKDLGYFADPSRAKDFSSHFGYHTFKTRFIGYLTFALNYKIHGLNPVGYHIVNLFVHICTALLVYFLILFTFKTPFMYTSNLRPYSVHIAVFTALFFACHPLQTEAITYIWQRVASLSAMLYVLSLTAYVRWRLSTDRRQASTPRGDSNIKTISFYFLSLFAALCAMNTKQIAFTLPVIIALFEFVFFHGSVRKRTVYLVPFFLTTVIIPVNHIGIDKPLGSVIGDVGEATRYLTEMSRLDYLFTQFRVIITYIRLIFLPVGQNLDYDYPVYRSFFNAEVLLSFLVLLSLFGAGVYLLVRFRHSLPHTRLLSFGIFWFFITLSVESSVIPLIHVINEYRMYLPSIGIILVCTNVLFLIVETVKERGIRIERLVILALSTAVILLTITTYERNSIWKDEVDLWRDVVEKSPKKARGHNNLCFAYNNKGLYEKAAEHCRIAIQLDPDYVISYNNLGIAYASQGQTGKAIQQYQIAITKYPSFSRAYFNLGNAFQAQDNTHEAIEQYQKAVAINPGYVKAHLNLGKAYVSQGLFEKGIGHFRIASSIKSGSAEIHYNLGVAYGKSDLYSKSIKELKETLRINPGHLNARINLGVTYGKSKRYEEAIKEFQKALILKPDSAEIHVNLASAYKFQGLTDKAKEHFSVARKLNPAFMEKMSAHQEAGKEAHQ